MKFRPPAIGFYILFPIEGDAIIFPVPKFEKKRMKSTISVILIHELFFY